jgi:phosphoenolpyruvate carboxykinase (ATP)
MAADRFASLQHRLLAYLQGKDLFIQDCFAGADPAYRLPIRVITETAWHNLFARNMFIQGKAEALARHVPQFTVINAPNFHAVPEVDGTRSEVFIVIHFGQKLAGMFAENFKTFADQVSAEVSHAGPQAA